MKRMRVGFARERINWRNQGFVGEGVFIRREAR
jgi:hypothetical protein